MRCGGRGKEKNILAEYKLNQHIIMDKTDMSIKSGKYGYWYNAAVTSYNKNEKVKLKK